MSKTKSLINYLPWIFWVITVGFVVISRWVYKSVYLFHHDSVQFALALNNFDVTIHQPHPPGYIFYIWLAGIVNYFLDNPNLSFIVLGIIATIVGLVAIYYLAREIFGVTAGYLAGIFFVINASVWFHGLVAEVYIVEMAVTLLALLFMYRFWKNGKKIDLLFMALLVGLVGGLRQTAEIFIFPVAIFSAYKHIKVVINSWLEVLTIFIVANLLWAVPLISLSGGVGAYLKSLSLLTSATVIKTYLTQGTNVLIVNGSLLWQTIKQAVPIGMVILFLSLLPFIAAESKSRYRIKWPVVGWWLWAIIPGILFIPFILMRNPGYGLYFVVIIILLTAGGVGLIHKVVIEWRKNWGNWISTFLVVVIIVSQTLIFFRLPALSLDYTSASLSSIEWVETILDDVTSHIKNNFDENKSIIFINNDLVFFGVRHLQYYLPEYDIYSIRPEALAMDEKSFFWHVKGEDVSKFEADIVIPANIKQVVFWGGNNNLPQSEYFNLQKTEGNYSIGYFDIGDENTRQELMENENYKFFKLLDE